MCSSYEDAISNLTSFILTSYFCHLICRAPPFEPKPSLAEVVEYLAKIMRNFPTETCPVCEEPALPPDAKVSEFVLVACRVYTNFMFIDGFHNITAIPMLKRFALFG